MSDATFDRANATPSISPRSISVVIPCYRSRDTLPKVVAGLQSELPKLADNYEIICVVDGSPDDTYAVARGMERDDPEHVRAVLLRRNYGQHNAIVAGLARATYEITVTMDDDEQHRADQLPALLAPLDDPMVDMVYGVAREEEHGALRSLASRAVKSGLAVAGVPNARDVSAFRAFRTDLRDGFAHVADTFASIDVMLSWTTTAIRRVELRMDQRSEGRSSYTITALVRHALNMVTGYGTLPLRLVSVLGGLCALLGLVLLVVVLVKFVTGRTQVAGFTTLASMIALFSGAQMLGLGIVGEYLGRLHFRSMQRPTFLVRVDGRDDGPLAGVPGTRLPTVRERERPDDVADAIDAGRSRRAVGPR